jgi:4-hydroxybenzoate polyprenyltransferase
MGIGASEPRHALVAPSLGTRLRAHLSILRPDHWFKNVFMLLGVALAAFYHADVFRIDALPRMGVALAATCVCASSNYALNELLDARTDLHHFKKRTRPIPAGLVSVPAAYAEWIVAGVIGLALAVTVNARFAETAGLLLVMGLVYNVPPVRSKDLPYLDVLSESLNNPIRLGLGWFAVTTTDVPPVCMLVAYWMLGAFFMASKRFAEYRALDDRAAAAAYRTSFRHYDEQRLLISMFFYVTTFALFLGVFIVRYHLELILSFPLIAGFVCYYLHVAFMKDSPCQAPERLHRQRALMAYLVLCVAAFVFLMFARIPVLYSVFNVDESRVTPLWHLGSP